MKHPSRKPLAFVAALVAALAVSAPSSALTVTNLDNVPHTVTYDAAGSHFEATAQPDETVRFVGLTDGKLSLKSADPKPSRGNLHADGMLLGIIGVARDQDIPADESDDYVIWHGGELQLQRHNREQWHH